MFTSVEYWVRTWNSDTATFCWTFCCMFMFATCIFVSALCRRCESVCVCLYSQGFVSCSSQVCVFIFRFWLSLLCVSKRLCIRSDLYAPFYSSCRWHRYFLQMVEKYSTNTKSWICVCLCCSYTRQCTKSERTRFCYFPQIFWQSAHCIEVIKMGRKQQRQV